MSGEEQELRKAIDFIRLGSIVILVLHFYGFLYGAFEQWRLTAPIVKRVLLNLHDTGLFQNFITSKLLSLALLLVSLLGTKGKKDEKIRKLLIVNHFVVGGILYFGSQLLLYIQAPATFLAVWYMLVTGTGFLFILSGGSKLSRIIKQRPNKDIFNRVQETFPQEERLLANEYSINLPARYNLKGKIRSSYINIINPFRGTLCLGSPGSGKSYFFVRHVLTQHIKKGFTLFCYDFKFDDLSRIVYNTLLKNGSSYVKPPSFFLINFDDLSRTHRCNPLDPQTMDDITDATESARTIMLGLNREWTKKQGDFWVESPINFLTGILWFLRRYMDGKYCTLPHAIELMQIPYEQLFPVLRLEPECEAFLNPFVSAFENSALEQLEGQVASAKIGMARLSSPQLYFVMSGNDFTLDINDPDDPKVVCMGNNPQKLAIYGAALSLYITRLIKIVNKKNMLKSTLIFDEFPTIYFAGMDSLIATARSNKVATTLTVQDASQLRKDYGKEQADVIMNIVGNIISGQVSGDTAKQLSERFGKIMQEKESLSINRTDTSISKSTQLNYAVPASKIAGLSSGEFVGMVADNPDQKIDLKTFHCEILNDHAALKREEEGYRDIPVIYEVTAQEVQDNYYRIKKDIQQLIATEMERIQNDPDLAHLIIRNHD